MKIYVDEAYETNINVFSKKLEGFNVINTRSMAGSYADLVSGEAGLSLFCGARKMDLETVIGFSLVKEAGGNMVTLDRQNLNDRKYFELSYAKDYFPVIAGANDQLIENLIKKIE